MTILDNLDRIEAKQQMVQNAIISLRTALRPVSVPEDLPRAEASEPQDVPHVGEVERRMIDTCERLDSFIRQLDDLRNLLEIGGSDELKAREVAVARPLGNEATPGW